MTRTLHAPLSRRQAGALALTGVTAVTALSLLPGPSASAASSGGAKNIILLVGDGMGRTHVTAGRERFYGAAGRLTMEKAPVVGQVSTYASEKDSNKPELVTDSASSATAWSSGVKTYNAALGVDAYGRRVETLMEQAKRAGMRTGNVSTAEITDATPAGMMSHALLRGCQGPVYSDAACVPAGDRKPQDTTLITPIAEQIARNGTADVILGGGLARFEPADAQAFRAQGYTVLGDFGDPALPEGGQSAATQRVATRAGLARVQGDDRRVVGLFNRGNLTVERAKRQAPADAAVRKEPTLAAMTDKAIELLGATAQPGKGFLLQVEGALIDKRSHANDAAQVLDEIKAFDDAVAIEYEFARQDGNTLVIVTADHECAGFSIVEPGTYTNAEAKSLPNNVDTGNPANNGTPFRPVSGTLDPERSNGPLNDERNDPTNFAPATFRTPDDAPSVRDGDEDASLWVSYLSGNHTGEDVPLYSTGPGSRRFAGSIDNTEIYSKMFATLDGLTGTTPNRPLPALAPAG